MKVDVGMTVCEVCMCDTKGVSDEHACDRESFHCIVKNAQKSRTWQWASGHIHSRSKECIGTWRLTKV